jgi:cell division protein FtsB
LADPGRAGEKEKNHWWYYPARLIEVPARASLVWRVGDMKRSNQRREVAQAQQKRRWRLYVIGAIFMTSYFTYSFLFDSMGFMKYLSMKRTQAQIADDIQALQEKNARLRKDIDAVKNDPVTVETLARERLGMVRKDETVFLVVPEVGRP